MKTEMKKIHLLLLLLAAMLASCSSDSFKIDGTLVNLHGTAVRVVLMTDSGMVDESVEVRAEHMAEAFAFRLREVAK